jgi:hypothetical protein
MGEMKITHTIFAESPFRRPRCRWGNNIKMGLKEIGYEYVILVEMSRLL